MKKKNWLALFAGWCVLSVAGMAFGAGFALTQGSARSNVLGSGFTATADDPSALLYNPAGITQLPGIQTMLGMTTILPHTQVTMAGTTTGLNANLWYAPHAYLTYQLNDCNWLGLGVFSPFGLGTEFPSTWAGRYNNYYARIKTVEINPNWAYKVNDKLSIALGLNVMWFQFKDGKAIPTAAGDVHAELLGDSWGWGFNAAVQYRPLDWMSLGVSYRSRESQQLEGDASFVKPAGLPSTYFRNTSAHGDLNLPDEVFIGIAFKPMKNLTIGGGGIFTRWNTFDALTIVYDTNLLGGAGTTVSSTPKNWKNVWKYQVGVEWNALDWLDLRLGFTYDEEPIPDSSIDMMVPGNDRQMYSFGVGFHRYNWTLDLSYTYEVIQDRDVAARAGDGILTATQIKGGDAHLIGMSLGYKF
jgi:long-chain fatty acid transport protein